MIHDTCIIKRVWWSCKRVDAHKYYPTLALLLYVYCICVVKYIYTRLYICIYTLNASIYCLTLHNLPFLSVLIYVE